MFGSVLVRFQAWMKEELGRSGWEELLQQAGLPSDKTYRTIKCYPDEELDKLMVLASAKLGIGLDLLWKRLGKDFGRYLLKTYKVMFFPSWRTMEVIEKAAPKVFRSIQFIDPNAPKSWVKCDRVAPDEVVVHYMSPRKMCPYILGIIDAMGEHFGEKIEVWHEGCMRNNGSECTIHVKLIKANVPKATTSR